MVENMLQQVQGQREEGPEIVADGVPTTIDFWMKIVPLQAFEMVAVKVIIPSVIFSPM